MQRRRALASGGVIPIHSLFPCENAIPSIPGLAYIPDYIDEPEQRRLAAAIDQMPWDARWQRRIQPYGGVYGRGGSAPPIPDWGRRLALKLRADGITATLFDQMLVNEYLPGQGIALHRDYEPYDRTVVSLSLLSPYLMDFREPATGRMESILLEPRSLLVLSDAARYEWRHGIARRKSDVWQGVRIDRGRRLSVTFRKVNEPKV